MPEKPSAASQPTPPPYIGWYVDVRRAVRSFFIRHPSLDRIIGRQLVQIDVALHGHGLLRHLRKNDRIDWNGFTLFYDSRDINLINQLYLHGEYEIVTQDVMKEALKPGMTFLDLGAHIGVFTLFAARLVGDSGKVFAFEPSPHTRKMLERNVETNRFSARVTIAPYATSDKAGVLRFVDGPISDAASVAQPGETEHVIEVEATTIDEYFAGRGWPPVDFVKMDIEGQELGTLRGMTGLVARNPGIKIVFEYNLGQLERCHISSAELFATLAALGFKRFTVLFRERISMDLPAQLTELDALAKRANMNILAER